MVLIALYKILQGAHGWYFYFCKRFRMDGPVRTGIKICSRLTVMKNNLWKIEQYRFKYVLIFLPSAWITLGVGFSWSWSPKANLIPAAFGIISSFIAALNFLRAISLSCLPRVHLNKQKRLLGWIWIIILKSEVLPCMNEYQPCCQQVQWRWCHLRWNKVFFRLLNCEYKIAELILGAGTWIEETIIEIFWSLVRQSAESHSFEEYDRAQTKVCIS